MAASKPTSAIDICNLALDRLGIDPISSIDEPTTIPEIVCARHYVQTRRELLRQYIFNFSKKYAVLTSDAIEEPAFGFSTAFALPNDFLRLLALGDVTLNGDVHPALFDLSNGYIYTDHEDDDDSLNIHYVYDNETVAKYDSLFIKVLKLQLASNVAYKFTLKPSLLRDLAAELQQAHLEAAAVAGQEKPPRRVERSKFRDAHRQGRHSRDLRYV